MQPNFQSASYVSRSHGRWLLLAMACGGAALILPLTADAEGSRYQTGGNIYMAETKPPVPARGAAQGQRGPVAPANAVLAATPAAAVANPQNGIGGAWRVNWIRQNKGTLINISAERNQPGITNFDGQLTSLDGSECKGNGFAAKTLGGVFPSSGEVNMVGVADYVRIVTQCASGQVWLEGLGVSGNPLQWVGRAVIIDQAGGRTFESFVMTR